MWLVWGGMASTWMLFSNISSKKATLYTWLLCESIIRRCFWLRRPCVFKKHTKQIPYLWNLCFVMYPFIVAATCHPTGTFWVQYCWTHCPLCMTMGGHTKPTPLTKESIVDVSPYSPITVWLAGVPVAPTTNCSFGTFWTPVSSPDHICSGELMPRSFKTCSYSSNHLCTWSHWQP